MKNKEVPSWDLGNEIKHVSAITSSTRVKGDVVPGGHTALRVGQKGSKFFCAFGANIL